MSGFVLRHLVDGVVDGVVAEFLRLHGDGQLAFAGAGFGFVALLEVGLGVPDHLAEQFGDAGGMVGLLEGVALEGIGDFRITFAFSLTAHGKVHADFGAFSGKVFLKAGPDFRVAAFGHAEFMLAGPLGLAFFFLYFDELFSLGVAYGAFSGRVFAFVDVSAYEAAEFFLHDGIL